MLQIDVTPFASDALEDAMRLAQTKALNSYTFSDCMSYLNYAWADIYKKIALIDSGYYSKTVRLTKKLTKLPPFVMNAVHVYSALQQRDYNRIEYRQSSQADMVGARTFYISGTDIYCPDAERVSVWLEYVPVAPQIFFTHHNRDPKIYDQAYEKVNGDVHLNPDVISIVRHKLFGIFELKALYNKHTAVITRIRKFTNTAGTPPVTTITYKKYTKTKVYYDDDLPLAPDYFTIPDSEAPESGGETTTATAEGTTYTVTDSIETFDWSNNASWTKQADGTYLLNNAHPLFWRLINRAASVGYDDYVDITDMMYRETEYDDKWNICYLSCEFPYIFISWQHSVTGEHLSGFITKELEFIEYNPFAFQGTNSNVAYVKCAWNDKTGMGVVIQDFNDIIDDEDLGGTPANMPRVKELGWTPDTKLVYPAPEVYRYLVALLADKFAALNESSVMGVQKELIEASYAFEAFLNKNKASMSRIINVNPVSPGDYL